MLKLKVNELIMETTRRCNMQCKMCLRGAAESEDMLCGVINTTFSVIDEVYEITPTGGEPFLVPEITAKVLNKAFDRGATHMYFSTNGSVSPFSLEAAPIMNAASKYLIPPFLSGTQKKDLEKLNVPPGIEDWEECRFCVSFDRFHDEYLGMYSHWRLLSNVEFNGLEDSAIISRGLARDNGCGNVSKEEETIKISSDVESGENVVTVKLLYVNVFGECFADCNLSYEEQYAPATLEPHCYLGHISRLRETVQAYANGEWPELFNFEAASV